MSADDKLEPVAWQNPSTGHVVGGAGAQDHRYTQALFPASALEASEAKIAALTAENATLREERHLADNALVDRYRDPKTGSFQFPTDVAAIVRRLDATEAERDELQKRYDIQVELSRINNARAEAAETQSAKLQERAVVMDGLLAASDVWFDYGGGFRVRFSFDAGADWPWQSDLHRLHTDARAALRQEEDRTASRSEEGGR